VDVLGAELAFDSLADRSGQLVVAALAVDLLGDCVQKAGELDDLPVGSAGDERRLLEAGVLVAPDQLRSLDEAWRLLLNRLGLRAFGALFVRGGDLSPPISFASGRGRPSEPPSFRSTVDPS
jgi:hypothetical protein